MTQQDPGPEPRLDIKSRGGEISVFPSRIGKVGIYVNDDYEGSCAVFYADKAEMRQIIDILENLLKTNDKRI